MTLHLLKETSRGTTYEIGSALLQQILSAGKKVAAGSAISSLPSCGCWAFYRRNGTLAKILLSIVSIYLLSYCYFYRSGIIAANPTSDVLPLDQEESTLRLLSRDLWPAKDLVTEELSSDESPVFASP